MSDKQNIIANKLNLFFTNSRPLFINIDKYSNFNNEESAQAAILSRAL